MDDMPTCSFARLSALFRVFPDYPQCPIVRFNDATQINLAGGNSFSTMTTRPKGTCNVNPGLINPKRLFNWGGVP